MRNYGAVFLAAVFATALAPARRFAPPLPSDGRGGDGRGDRERFALVLIDSDGLACSPCFASLLEFCRAVPPEVQEKRIVGVLTFRDGIEPDPRRARIARTRWTGYGRANDIRFPVTVDEAHVFNRLSEEGTTILLFHPATGTLEKRTAPFGPGVLEEVVRFLVTRETPIIGPLP